MKLIIVYLLYCIGIDIQPNIWTVIGLFGFSVICSLFAHYLKMWQLKKIVKEVNKTSYLSSDEKIVITVNLNDLI